MQNEKQGSATRYIGILNRQFRLYCDEELAPYGLTNGLYLYLIFVHYHPDCSQTDIRDEMQVDKALVTRMVTRLTDLGYLMKERRPEDGRSFALKLTDQGEEVFARIRLLPHQWEMQMTEGFSEEEKESLARLLQKAYRAVENRK